MPATTRLEVRRWRHGWASMSVERSPTWSSTTRRPAEVTVGKGSTTPGTAVEGVLACRHAALTATLAASRASSCTARPSASTRCSSARERWWACSPRAASATCWRSGAGSATPCTTLLWTPPPPLVPRRLRLPVTRAHPRRRQRRHAARPGRRPRGGRGLRRARASSRVAIVFINAYANPAHELAAPERSCASRLRRARSRSRIEVSGEYREYERTSTTVIDAYVRPRSSPRYLRRLESDLRRSRVRRRVPDHPLRRRLRWPSRRPRSGRSRRSCPARSPAPSGAAELCRDARPRPGDHRRRRRHELRHLPDRRRPAADQVRGQGRRACRCRRRGSTCARSAPAAARSPTSTRAGCCVVGPRSAGADARAGLLRPRRHRADGHRRRGGARACSASGELAGGVRARHRRGARGARAARRGGSVSTPTRPARGVMTIVSATMADAIRDGHDRAGPGPARGDADRLRRRRPAVRRRCSRASWTSARSSSRSTPATSPPGACSAQDLTQSAARDLDPPLDDEGLDERRTRSRELFERLQARGTPPGGARRRRARRRSTCATSARSTRSRSRPETVDGRIADRRSGRPRRFEDDTSARSGTRSTRRSRSSRCAPRSARRCRASTAETAGGGPRPATAASERSSLLVHAQDGRCRSGSSSARPRSPATSSTGPRSSSRRRRRPTSTPASGAVARAGVLLRHATASEEPLTVHARDSSRTGPASAAPAIGVRRRRPGHRPRSSATAWTRRPSR